MIPRFFRPCPITLSILVAVLTASDLGAQTDLSSLAPKPDASKEVQAPRKPRTSGDLPTRVAMQLRVAFPLAVKRLRKVSSCQALFEELGANGVEKLAATEYRRPTEQQESIPRIRSAKAFTLVGSSKTMLCQSFGEVPRGTAAVTLIHEALHFAGLSERPVDPEGMTAGEIDRLVAKACRL